ncbi:MAG: molecular chaperone HtpG, partial [Muribaculaceae bacterium]|nr:molecular chaperone HtpG [Muribaculaceae bacterium]
PEEYKTLVEASQTDKDGDIIYLYATDPTAQYSYIKAAADRGYSVLVMDGQLDSHFVGLLESKLEKTRFVRVDSDVIDNLIRRDNKRDVELTPLQRNILTTAFRSQVPEVEKADFLVSFEALNATDHPIVITQNEYMRRMKDMAAMQPGMNFYADLPDSYNLVVNTEHTLVKKVRDAAQEAIGAQVQPIAESIEKSNAEITALRDSAKESADAETDRKISDLEKTVAENREAEEKIIRTYAAGQPLLKQLIDLALLGNGLLRGQALSDFISRSVSLL